MRLLILITILLLGCKIDSDKQVNREKFTFEVGDDTELFFKNIRQSYYDLEENRAAKFNVYRLERLSTDVDKPIINLAIVINYLQDEAYLLLEPNRFLSDEESLEVVAGDKEITLESFNHQAMLEFAAQIYEGILAGKKFKIMVRGKYRSFLDSKEEREAFRITVSDYFRLTRVY